MPRLSRWIIRTALLYLWVGITIGALLLAHKGVPLHPALWGWLPVHIEFMLVGWVVQLVMGVAFWLLPRYWTKPHRPRARLVLLAYLALNAGIWLAAVYDLGWGERPFLLTGRILETSAVLRFAIHAWNRIVSREGLG